MRPAKEWIPTIVSIISCVLLIGSNIVISAIQLGEMNQKIVNMEKHVDDTTLHIPWEKRIDIFITRREAEKADDEIKKTLNNIETKVDYIYRSAISNASNK